MKTQAQHQGGWLIIASFVVGYVLTVLPLPDALAEARPDWPALVLIYWCMAVPQRVGVGVGWLVGLFQDALQVGLLGQHALAYAVLAFLTIKLHQRMRVFPIWQQSMSVMVLLLLNQLILLWLNGFAGRPSAGWTYWLAALVGTLLWPAVFVVMRELRHGFSVR